MRPMALRYFFFGLLAALPLLAGGCKIKRPAESTILDVRPTRAQLGDTLIIEGRPFRKSSRRSTALPMRSFSAQAKRTTVVLQGHFTNANGQSYQDRVELRGFAVASAAHPAHADRVLVTLTAAHRHKLGWLRFAGQVVVVQKLADGDATFETAKGQTFRLNLFPPSQRGLAYLAVWAANDWRTLRWLGIKVEPVTDGLKITALRQRAGGAAASAVRGKLKVGDVLFRANKTPLISTMHLSTAVRQASRKRGLSLSAHRGSESINVSLPSRGKPLLLPATVIYLAVLGLFALICMAFAMGISGISTWVERRVAARMQYRVGPNRVGPQGLFQFVADGIKLVLKEDTIPADVDRPLFKLAPYLVFMGLLGTFIVIPFGQFLIVADLNAGLLFLMAITGFVALGLMMAGWSANNKWSLLGGMRSAAQIISYEIPTGLALMVPVVLAGTLSTHELVEQQGGLPWQWFAFDNPFLFICFIIYFISALAEGNRTPFDLPEAESELVAGYNIEYSGWRFAVFFLSEWANLFVIGAIATTVFLGGWQIPGVTLNAHAAHWYWQLLGLVIFMVKACSLVFVIIWIRWTLPRFRVDQMMSLCWKYFVPWTFASIIFAALWTWLVPEMGWTLWVRRVTEVATFLVCGLGLGYVFFSRVLYNFKTNPEKKFSWNPFY